MSAEAIAEMGLRARRSSPLPGNMRGVAGTLYGRRLYELSNMGKSRAGVGPDRAMRIANARPRPSGLRRVPKVGWPESRSDCIREANYSIVLPVKISRNESRLIPLRSSRLHWGNSGPEKCGFHQ